tara:strand:- start:639 stop:1304 length:666 start_codon:yes stop_codon:yes gene_type:complete
MSKIANKYFEGGQAPTATELNAVYNSVAGDSVQNVNLETEWAQRKHFSDSNSITSLFTFDYDGTTEQTISSTSFTTINNTGSNPSQVLPSYTTHGHVVVRVHASGLVTTCSLDVDDGNGTSGEINRNTYAFRLFMTTNSTTVDLANCTYSFTEKAAITTAEAGSDMGIRDSIQFRTFAFSGLFTLAPNNTIEKIELQACVGHNGNTFNVEHNHIQLIVVEN